MIRPPALYFSAMNRITALASTAALVMGALVLSPNALAESSSIRPEAGAASRTLQSAYRATVEGLESGGGSIVVDESGSRSRTLFNQPVGGQRTLEYAYGSTASGDYSVNVTNQGAALASWGSNPTDGRWSTLGAAGSWAPRFVAGSTLTLTTVVKGMDRRLDMDAADAATRQIMLDLALPPGSSNGGRSWTSMKAARSGAATVITARSRSKSCVYSSISVTIRSGVITESDWTSHCTGAGTVTRHAKWGVGGGAVGAGPLAITQAQAIATSSNPSRSNQWKALVAAANATAATTWSDVTLVKKSAPNTVEHQLTAVQGLKLLDGMIRAGATGAMWGSPPSGGPGVYTMTPTGTNGYISMLGDSKYSGGSVTVSVDGLITSMRLSYSDEESFETETVTFIR
jgi:hypothetical protein